MLGTLAYSSAPIGAAERIMGQIWEERGECGTRSVRLSRSCNTKHRPTSAMACEMAIATILPAKWWR